MQGGVPLAPLDVAGHLGDQTRYGMQVGHFPKPWVANGHRRGLQRPGIGEGHMHAPTACFKHWMHIGFERIANHHGRLGQNAPPTEDLRINLRSLLGHDLHPVEHLAQSRLRQLAFLVDQIPLGDEQQSIFGRQRLNGRFRTVQQLDRVAQHVLSGGNQLGDDLPRHAVFGHLQGGFDHRKREPLDPVTVALDVAPLRIQQPFSEMIGLGIIREKLQKPAFGQPEEPLIVPQCIIGIEADCREHPIPPFLTAPNTYIVRSMTATGVLADLTTLKLHMMASDDDETGDNGDGDTSLLTKTKPKTDKPPLYKVMLLNDDYTPMEFVVHVLERFFGMNHAQAFELMLTVHKKGLAVVGVFSFEVAETKVAQVMDFARRHQHPLQCTMEKE